MKLHFIPSDFYIKTNVGKISDFFLQGFEHHFPIPKQDAVVVH